MKKKKIDDKSRSPIIVPTTLKNEFRKICIVHDLNPPEVMKKIIGSWIEKQKKLPLIANG